jgi:hypothetical protein
MTVLSVRTDSKRVSMINASARSPWIKMLKALIEDLQHLDLLRSVCELLAMVDQGGGRHETDLRALNPTQGELIAAARWSITQDPSPGYRSVLVDALRVLGADDADLGD